MTDLSIIIVNYKGWERLSQCLNSLDCIHDTRYSFEVIVVDNNSNDGFLDKFQAQYPKISFVLNSGNFGFANGCNLGAGNSHGLYLLFLNPDTIVTSEALFVMLAETRLRRPFSIVSCCQKDENGSEESAYRKFLSPFNLTGWLRAINKAYLTQKGKFFQQTDQFIYPDWVSGSVIMIGRDSFLSMAGWDDDFWMYFEDVDLCRRARAKGGEIVLIKTVCVEHNHGGASRINLLTTSITKTEVNISRHIYISKHEAGWKAAYMHLFLILNNLIVGVIPAITGVILFFIGKLNIYSRTYSRLVFYYLNALKSGTWVSKRSVNYLQKTGILS